MTKEFDPKALVDCPRCEGALFLNAGLRILIRRQDYATTPLGRTGERYVDWEGHDTVYVCSHCLLPVTMDEGQIVDLSARINEEDVAAALLRGGYQIPALRRQDTKADAGGEEEGASD